MYGYIYKTTNLINGKIYIGQKKSEKFLGINYLGSGKRLWEAINKYGKDKFIVELVEEIDEEKLMDVREIYWIAYYNSTNKNIGYNLSEGGNVNRTLRGENNGFYGKHHSEESRRIMSQNNARFMLGKHHSQETKLKIGLGNKGKIISEDTKKKLSENAANNPNYGMRGKHLSEESKKKISDANKGKSKPFRGMVYITNDITSIRVNKEHLDDYLNNGWRLGRKKFSSSACKNISKGHKGRKAHNKGKIWINNEIVNKCIYKEELELYLSLGWMKGMIK